MLYAEAIGRCDMSYARYAQLDLIVSVKTDASMERADLGPERLIFAS